MGPDRRDIHDGFTVSRDPTSYPALWGHDSGKVKTLALAPNAHLVPRAKRAPGQPLRRANLLWGRAGRLLIAERLRLNTHRLTAGWTDRPVLSNVWWPCRPRSPDIGPAEEKMEKGLCIWLNSTPGLIVLLAHRTETEGAWVDFKKPNLADMPVPDRDVLSSLAERFDLLRDRELQPLSRLAEDPVRVEIDRAVEEVLELPRDALRGLRELLAREPVLTLGR